MIAFLSPPPHGIRDSRKINGINVMFFSSQPHKREVGEVPEGKVHA